MLLSALSRNASWKSLPEKAASTLKAKVPELWYGAHCTLSTLRDLYAVKEKLPELSSDRSAEVHSMPPKEATGIIQLEGSSIYNCKV